MNSLVIPPSPSWYLSNVIACNSKGTVAYGSRHELVIIKDKNETEVSPCSYEYKFIPVAHKDKVTCLVFAPNNALDDFKNCLATASDDGSVRLWDVDTLELKMINSGLKENQKILGVDWCQSDPNVVISVSDQAFVYSWDLPSNKLRKMNLGPKIYPVCLAACPHQKQLIAIGAKSGIVLIVNLKGEGSIKFRMRCHDSDVVSLSWCPVQYNIFQEHKSAAKVVSKSNGLHNGDRELTGVEAKENKVQNENESFNGKNELLLASGGKDRTIYFWRAGTDGRYETLINFPQQALVSGYRSRMIGEKGGNSIWGCMRWVDPYTILTGSQFGELLSWDLSVFKNVKTEKDKKVQTVRKPRLLHGNHSKGVFSIVCPIESVKPVDDKRLIWTTALDRKLIVCSLKTGDIVAELPTIGGIVYCLSVSALDPNRIAIGVGDGKIFVWNMGCTNKLDIVVHWQKINSKVMALDWHPTEENWLAFGTGEGRVGLLDINSNKPPLIFRQYHHRAVYRVLWAPHIKEMDASHTGKYEYALYSVGDGEVVQYSVNTPEKVPVKLNDIFKKADDSSKIDKSPGRTEFVMNHDCSLISVGNENGIVYILDGKTLEKCSVIIAFKKIVQCLVWHPSSVTSDPCGLSTCSNWLAAASDSVKVFSVNADGKTFETVAILSLQAEKIVDISWSPHLNGHLVSVSYDYTAQVWDVIKQIPLVNYNKHHNAVLCAVWSPLSPEFIISGSSDSTLRVWKLSEQPDTRPSDKKKNRVSGFLKRAAFLADATYEQDLNDTNIRREVNAVSIKSIKDSSSGKKSVDVEDVNPVAEWESGKSKRVRGKSLFPVNSSALNVSKHFNEYYQLWKNNKSRMENETNNSDALEVNGEYSPINEPSAAMPPEKEYAYFDFFGDRKAMRRLMKVEEDQLRGENSIANAILCSVWSGDITELIKDAMSKKSLNSWLMSVAPMCSYRVWQEACVVYSEQLANSGDFLTSASYLLAVHKVEEALELLCEHKFYREAVALAKCRLPADDPLIQKIMRQYAEYAVSIGSLSLGAHCYLSINDPLSASQTLARCKDLKSLKMAALLAKEAGAMEIADSLAKEAFCSSLMAGDFDSCLEVLSNHHNLEFLKIWIKTNKIVSEYRKLDLPTLTFWLENKGIDYESVLDKIKEEIQIFTGCYDKLKSNINCFNALDTEKQLWLFVSSHLSLAGAAESHAIALHHLVQALASAYRFQTLNNRNDVLMLTCVLISPEGLLSEKCIFRLQSNCNEEKNLMSSLRSFLLAGVVSWLNDHIDDVKSLLSKDECKDNTFNWFDSIIDLCRADIFDRRNVQYFKNETMIKNLELKIAASRCGGPNDKREQRVLLTAVRSKNRKTKKESDSIQLNDLTEDKDSCVEADEIEHGEVIENIVIEGDEEKAVTIFKEKGDEEKRNNEAVINVIQEASDDRVTLDCVTKYMGDLDIVDEITNKNSQSVEKENSRKEIRLPDSGLDLESKVNVSKLDKVKSESKDELRNNIGNSEVKTAFSVKVITCHDSKKNVPSNPSLVIEINDDEDSKSLKTLNAIKSKFESEKVSTPNPFFTYCQLQNVLTMLLKDNCLELFEKMSIKIQDSWKNSNF